MKNKQGARLLVLLLAICLTALAVAVAAAPAVTPNAPATHQPTGIKPPEREIKIIPAALTITAPTGGATWYTGATQTVTWAGNGPGPTALGPVDVTLWKGGQQVVLIAAATAAESATYNLPLAFATGAYELRVTSKNHANLIARQPLTIAATTVTLGPTPSVLVAGTNYNITWTKTGNPGPLDIALNYDSGGTSKRWYFIARGVTGNSYTWALSDSWANEQYKLQIQLTDAATGNIVYSTSTLFTIMGITFTAPQANEQVLPGSQYKIAWNYTADPEALFSLALVNQSGQETTLLTGLHPADRAAWWRSPQPTTGTTFRLKAYAGQVLLATSPAFTFKTPTLTVGKPFTNTVTSDGIVASHPYCIPYSSEFQPAPFKIEIVKVADDTVAETVIASTTLSQTASGLYCYWTPSATHPAAFYGQSYRVRLIGLGAVGGVTYSPPFIIYKTAPGSGSTGTPSGNTSTPSGSTGTPSGSTGTTTTGTVTVTPPASSGPSTVQLTSDTYYKYNAQDSAQFAKGSSINLDGSGYVTHGQLAGDQYIYYRSGKSAKIRGYSAPMFSGGYLNKGQLIGDQSLEYGSNRTVSLRSSSVATFTGGYVTQGQLDGDQGLEYASGKKVYLRSSSVADFANGYVTKGQLNGDQSLPYASGKTAHFRSSSVITLSGGYVTQGQLAYDTQLDYASGKHATFYTVGMTTFRSGGYVKSGTLAYDTYLTDTSGQSKNVPALSVVTFDDSGRMVSYNPPNFNLNP